MCEKPWNGEQLARTPYIDGLEFASEEHGVSVLRGIWDEDAQALVFSVKGWDFVGRFCPENVSVEPVARQLLAGSCAVYVNGKLIESKELKCTDGEVFVVKIEVKKREEVEIVFLKVNDQADGQANGHADSHAH